MDAGDTAGELGECVLAGDVPCAIVVAGQRASVSDPAVRRRPAPDLTRHPAWSPPAAARSPGRRGNRRCQPVGPGAIVDPAGQLCRQPVQIQRPDRDVRHPRITLVGPHHLLHCPRDRGAPTLVAHRKRRGPQRLRSKIRERVCEA
jgi:hypothetical protein